MIGHALYIAASLLAQTASDVRTDCFVRGKTTLIASAEELSQELRTAQKCRISSIRDKTNLRWYIEQGLLVPLEDSDSADYEISPDLAEIDPDDPELYLYVRPWTREFILTIASRALTEINVRLRFPSLVRPEDYQQRLRDYNSYAARESTHPTGSTVDISLRDLTWRERNWLRKYLLSLESDGLVEATEERGNYCMHVFVHPAFAPAQTEEPEPEPEDAEDILDLLPTSPPSK